MMKIIRAKTLSYQNSANSGIWYAMTKNAELVSGINDSQGVK